MASIEGKSSGPPQCARGVHGQYVYLIVMTHPKAATVQRLGLKIPGDFTRETFRQTIGAAHEQCDIKIVETATFEEPHADGRKHRSPCLCGEPPTKKAWAARGMVKKLAELKMLMDSGCLSREEFDMLKKNMLSGV